MTTEVLTNEEEAALRHLYRKCVTYWSWSLWVANYQKWGIVPIGLSWVILPYKPEKTMPFIRRRMNELYWEALQGQAAEYGLNIRLDQATNKIQLYGEKEA